MQPFLLRSAADALLFLRAARPTAAVVVAVDPGTHKIGVAAAAAASPAPHATIAFEAPRPLCALRAPPSALSQWARDDFFARVALGALRGLSAPPALVLVGLPLEPHEHVARAATGQGARRAEALLSALRRAGLDVAVPALLWDERGSSAAARARLRAAGTERAREELFRAGCSGDSRSDSALTRALRLRQRAARALPAGVRERVDAEAAVEILASFLDALNAAASASSQPSSWPV